MGELFCFGFASQLLAERNLSPHPLYNKVKNNLRRLFFTKGSQTRNTKFSILKIRVSVRQIWIQIYSKSGPLQIYGKRFARVFCRLC